MENYSLMWEIYYDLSEDTQTRLWNSANNLRRSVHEAGGSMTLPEAMTVIFQTVKFLEGKDIKK